MSEVLDAHAEVAEAAATRSVGSLQRDLPELTGLRGVAVLIVVVGHLMQRVDRFYGEGASGSLRWLLRHTTSPSAGVFLFFVISGFLIAERVAPQRELSASWIGAFYYRRFTRIAIPYYFVLLATFLAMSWLPLQVRNVKLYGVVPASLFDSLLASLGFSHYAVWGTFPRLFPPGWSNEVELQFYLSAPLLCVGYARYRGMLRPALAAVMLVASLALSWLLFEHGPANLKYSLFVYLPYFWLGIVLADSLRGARLPRLGAAWGWAALFVFVFAQPYVAGHLSELALRCALITILLASAFVRAGSFWRLCVSASMRTLGRYAFSIYLVNLQIVHVVTDQVFARLHPESFGLGLCAVILIATPLVGVVTYVFHHLVERPAMRVGIA